MWTAALLLVWTGAEAGPLLQPFPIAPLRDGTGPDQPFLINANAPPPPFPPNCSQPSSPLPPLNH